MKSRIRDLWAAGRLCLIMTGVIMMVLSGMILEGCGKTAEKEARIKKILEEKYGEEFEVTRVYGQGVMEKYYTAEAYAVEYPDLPFPLNIDEEGGSFMDGYVMKRGTNLMASQAAVNLGGLRNPFYVHVQSMFPNSVSTNPNQTLKEYLASEETNFFTFYLYLDVDGETPESLYASLRNMLAGMEEAEGSVEIFFGDEKLMDQIREYVESHATLEDDYSKIGRDRHVMGIRFNNGVLAISEDCFLDKAGNGF